MQKRLPHVAYTLAILSTLTGCWHKEPNVIYMPDMVYSPAIKAQGEGSMRMPVKGTIPRDYQPYQYANDPEKAGRELKNPLPRTKEVLERGEHVFKTNCMVCHGLEGLGDGSIIPKFPRPPSLHSDKVRTWPDGRIYHVITKGQNLMPSYEAQVPVGDRWAAIHYVRVLQKAKHPTAEDLKSVEHK